ncbi:hypothetical protein [Cellulophaga sp. Z1A5H]|uniref:hypothetical protein n=1 Tax=Cellulophaga sp. Z1A5H TaxID=2687291 RepID=UPI0013FE15F2|nr:hypothetical protein [Cellulophaga sp. Z1A5H]
MKNLSILITIIFFLSCSNTPKDISGTYSGSITLEEKGESGTLNMKFILTHIGNNEYSTLSSLQVTDNSTGETTGKEPKEGSLVYYPETGYLKHPIGSKTMQISENYDYLFFTDSKDLPNLKLYKE